MLLLQSVPPSVGPSAAGSFSEENFNMFTVRHDAVIGWDTDEGSKADFEVKLIRQGPSWRQMGLVLIAEQDARYLEVDAITEPSSIVEWNDTHDHSVNSRPGDRIITVSDKACDANTVASMMQSLVRGSGIILHIERGSG